MSACPTARGGRRGHRHGQPRAVDVAEVNGRVFVNNAVLGVYPYMVADRERRRERHGLGNGRP